MLPRVITVSFGRDSCAFLVEGRGAASGVAVVDPGDTESVVNALERERLRPVEIWLTHRHDSHQAGANDLARRFDLLVRAPEDIHDLNARTTIQSDAPFNFSGLPVCTFTLVGHCRRHLVYQYGDALFTGDAYLAGGCGEVIEGSTEEMMQGYESQLATLSPETRIFSAHDSAWANLRFALDLEPDNPALRRRQQEIELKHRSGEPALPVRLADELRVNPFLRARDPRLRSILEGRLDALLLTPAAVFAALYRLRREFAGESFNTTSLKNGPAAGPRRA